MMMQKLIKIWHLLLGVLFVAPLALIIPKRRNLILFIGNGDGQFRDNVKYLYLHLYRSNLKNVAFFFLTENKDVLRDLRQHNLPVIFYPKLSTFWLMCRAGSIIADNFAWIKNAKYFFFLKAIKVQLWHGCSIKRLELDDPLLTRELKTPWGWLLNRLSGRFPEYDFLLSTSDLNTREIFRPAFRFKNIIESGYPRNDILFSKPDDLDLIGTDLAILSKIEKLKRQNNKIILYAPTFRDTGSGDDFLEKNALDMQRLDDFAGRNRLVIVFKVHPLRILSFDFEESKNLCQYHPTGDIYPFLPLVDCLVTDYSSLFFDYLYLNRPIVFYPYDYEKYIRQDRGLKYDYSWVTPGPKCYNQNELERTLLGTLTGGKDAFAQKRRDIFEMSFSQRNGSASERILNIISEKLLAKRVSLESACARSSTR